MQSYLHTFNAQLYLFRLCWLFFVTLLLLYSNFWFGYPIPNWIICGCDKCQAALKITVKITILKKKESPFSNDRMKSEKIILWCVKLHFIRYYGVRARENRFEPMYLSNIKLMLLILALLRWIARRPSTTDGDAESTGFC